VHVASTGCQFVEENILNIGELWDEIPRGDLFGELLLGKFQIVSRFDNGFWFEHLRGRSAPSARLYFLHPQSVSVGNQTVDL
jgi:hypothetical protein